MPRILRRPLAGADVDEIWDYLAEDSMGEADARVVRLVTKLRLLDPQPLMGHSRDELSPGVRSLPFGRYVIRYLPLADGIDVVRVLHSERDVEAIFEKDPPDL